LIAQHATAIGDIGVIFLAGPVGTSAALRKDVLAQTDAASAEQRLTSGLTARIPPEIGGSVKCEPSG
jgi:hypothetical protein